MLSFQEENRAAFRALLLESGEAPASPTPESETEEGSTHSLTDPAEAAADQQELISGVLPEPVKALATDVVQSLVKQDIRFGEQFAEHIRHFLDEEVDQSMPEDDARHLMQEVRVSAFLPGDPAGRPPWFPPEESQAERPGGPLSS